MMSLHMASRRGLLRLLGTALVALAIGALSGCASTPDTAAGRAATDPLPSWNDSAAKQSIVAFVERVTQAGSPDFVPVPERIAVFDNDGTLWAEQPMYFQGFFVLDRVKALAPQHPQWKTKEPFASLLKGDIKGVAAAGEQGAAGNASWRPMPA